LCVYHPVVTLIIANYVVLQVIVADNFFSGSKDNLKRWIGHPNFELIRHDVTETLLVEVDQIYHLACPASPIFYKYNPVKTIKTNVMGTLNMLGLAKRVGARCVICFLFGLWPFCLTCSV
jgi:UDP-glucuronate decarboxylase